MKYEVVDKEGKFVLLTSSKSLAELTAKRVGGSIIDTYLVQSGLAQANPQAKRQGKAERKMQRKSLTSKHKGVIISIKIKERESDQYDKR